MAGALFAKAVPTAGKLLGMKKFLGGGPTAPGAESGFGAMPPAMGPRLFANDTNTMMHGASTDLAQKKRSDMMGQKKFLF